MTVFTGLNIRLENELDYISGYDYLSFVSPLGAHLLLPRLHNTQVLEGFPFDILIGCKYNSDERHVERS
jgi:uroporphyrinogen-III synthase